jgi:hypothetical protein
VNVALLLVEDRARIVTDNQFQKLKCILSNVHIELLKFWLADIAEQVETGSPEEARLLISSRTAQFQLSDPHELPSGVSKSVEACLVDLFLRRHRQLRHRVPEIETTYIESRIDEVVSQASGIAATRLLRNVKPGEFLSQTSVRELGKNGFKVARVLPGSRRLILMDGIDLDNPNRAQVKNRTQDVGYAFFSLGQIKAKVEAYEQKELFRAAFVLHEEKIHGDRHFEYYSELLRREADAVIDPTKESDRKKLNDIVQAAVAA